MLSAINLSVLHFMDEISWHQSSYMHFVLDTPISQSIKMFQIMNAFPCNYHRHFSIVIQPRFMNSWVVSEWNDGQVTRQWALQWPRGLKEKVSTTACVKWVAPFILEFCLRSTAFLSYTRGHPFVSVCDTSYSVRIAFFRSCHSLWSKKVSFTPAWFLSPLACWLGHVKLSRALGCLG